MTSRQVFIRCAGVAAVIGLSGIGQDFVQAQTTEESEASNGQPILQSSGSTQETAVMALPPIPDFEASTTSEPGPIQRLTGREADEEKKKKGGLMSIFRRTEKPSPQPSSRVVTVPGQPGSEYLPYHGPAILPETPTGKTLKPFGKNSRYIQNDQVVAQGTTPPRPSIYWMDRLVNPETGEPTGSKWEWSSPFTPRGGEVQPYVVAETTGGGAVSVDGTEVAVGPGAAEDRNVPLIGNLQGIVVVPRTLDVQKEGIYNVTGVVANNVVLPPRVHAELASHLGQPLSLESLDGMVKDTIVEYRRSDLPVVDVLVPEQEITTGVLQLVVIEGRLGDIIPEGNTYTSDEFLASNIRVARGEVLRESILMRDIAYLNRNPFRRVDLIFSPGTDYGTTDLILRTEDARPFSVYAGIENSGTELLGEERIIGGVNWGGPLFLGPENTLSYQYTSDIDFDRVEGHSAVYTGYLPWRHYLTLLGAYVDSEVTTVVDGEVLSIGGQSKQVSARYAIPIEGPRWLNHELELGFDYKSSNSNLGFNELEVFDTTAEILQFSLGYNITQRDAWGTTKVDSEVVYSPGDLTNKNSDEVFDEQRAGAEADYVYGRIAVERTVELPAGFLGVARVEGQLSNRNLLASETLGAGGYDTVRGYEMRIVRGDQGILAGVELRTPAVSPANFIGFANARDGLQALAFYDFGYLESVDLLPDEPDSLTLGGAGVGLRYQLDDNVSVRLDYGWQVQESGFEDDDDGRFHAGARVSF